MLINDKSLPLKFQQLEKLVVQRDDDINAIFKALKKIVQQRNELRGFVGYKSFGEDRPSETMSQISQTIIFLNQYVYKIPISELREGLQSILRQDASYKKTQFF